MGHRAHLGPPPVTGPVRRGWIESGTEGAGGAPRRVMRLVQFAGWPIRTKLAVGFLVALLLLALLLLVELRSDDAADAPGVASAAAVALVTASPATDARAADPGADRGADAATAG